MSGEPTQPLYEDPSVGTAWSAKSRCPSAQPSRCVLCDQAAKIIQKCNGLLPEHCGSCNRSARYGKGSRPSLAAALGLASSPWLIDFGISRHPSQGAYRQRCPGRCPYMPLLIWPRVDGPAVTEHLEELWLRPLRWPLGGGGR